MITETTETRIFLTDLAAYNEGKLIGKWIDLPCDNLNEELQNILQRDNEEYFITDWESDVLEIGEYSDIFLLNAQAEQTELLDESDKKKIKYLIDYNGATFEEAIEIYEDVELYEDMNMIELAEMFIDETWEVPEHLVNYIDTDKFAYDLSYDYTEIDNDVFRSA